MRHVAAGLVTVFVVAATGAGCMRPDPSVAYAQPVGGASSPSRPSPATISAAPLPAEPTGVRPAAPTYVPPAPVSRTSFAPPAVAPRSVVPDVPANGWRVRTELRVGNPRGHVQIPKGGQPGTTSPGRPTFDEVGVESAWEPVVDVSYRRGRHVLHAGAGAWLLHGSEVLTEPLTSHQKFYAAGTDVDSGTELWEAWLGYGHTFSLGRCWTITPGIGAYVSRIDYSITGAGQTSERAFSSVSPMLEAELAWHPGGQVHLSADVRVVADEWLGFSSPTQVLEGALRAHVDLSPCSRISFAIGATSIQHHDEQPVPNDYLVEVLPWFAFGGEFRF